MAEANKHSTFRNSKKYISGSSSCPGVFVWPIFHPNSVVSIISPIQKLMHTLKATTLGKWDFNIMKRKSR